MTITYEPSFEFLHYGVKGMKWGIRRYQPYSTTGPRKGGKTGQEIGQAAKSRNRKFLDKNGNLTEKGIKTVLSNLDIKEREYVEQHKKEAGITTGNGDIDTIKKGSIFQRITGGEETVDDRRKYMSITMSDNQTYDEVSDLLDFDPGSKIYYDRYEAIKDLKVANEKAVKKYVLSKYGNTKLKDLVKDADKGKEFVNQLGDLKLKNLYIDETNKKLNWVIREQGKTDSKTIYPNQYRYDEKYGHDSKLGFSYNYYQAGKTATREILNKLSKNPKMHSDMIDYFKKAGVDAIVDLEDRNAGFEYPLIVLNPKNSTKRTGHI